MARPVKWSRDIHAVRERAERSRTETWSRQDIEHLFDVGRASSQTLMKAIGEVQRVGGGHFVDRSSLLEFLNEMVAADSLEGAFRARLMGAEPAPRSKPLRVSLPADLRCAMLRDLPANILLEPGRLEVRADSAEKIVESLMTLGMIMQNDLESVFARLEPPPPPRESSSMDKDLREMLRSLREPSPPHA